jgi:hypothetical protein
MPRKVGSSTNQYSRPLCSCPRGARVVALEKPSEVERGQWYFQRYIEHLPTAGEIVLFRTGYTDTTFKPLPDAPAQDECFTAPLAGKSEGWPTLAPEVIALLATRGVRCVGMDTPTAGGVQREASLMTYWAAAKHKVLIVEFLIGQPAAGIRCGYCPSRCTHRILVLPPIPSLRSPGHQRHGHHCGDTGEGGRLGDLTDAGLNFRRRQRLLRSGDFLETPAQEPKHAHRGDEERRD